MKILPDENIPVALVAALRNEFAVVDHVKQLGLLRAGDDAIWQLARRDGYAVVTQDKDFFERSRFDSSVKVIWLRFGNSSVRDFEVWLRAEAGTIREFLERTDENSLVLKRPQTRD